MAIIEKCSSLLTAEAILVIVTVRLQEGSYWVDCYQNGREQGYSIVRADTKDRVSVAFAEYRSGDSPVVYFDGWTNQGVTEKGYASARHCKTIQEAVDVCVDHLERRALRNGAGTSCGQLTLTGFTSSSACRRRK